MTKFELVVKNMVYKITAHLWKGVAECRTSSIWAGVAPATMATVSSPAECRWRARWALRSGASRTRSHRSRWIPKCSRSRNCATKSSRLFQPSRLQKTVTIPGDVTYFCSVSKTKNTPANNHLYQMYETYDATLPDRTDTTTNWQYHW